MATKLGQAAACIPSESARGVPLSCDTAYLNNGGSRKCRNLLHNYITQFNNYSCSVAAVAVLLNTALPRFRTGMKAEPITQQEILARVRVLNWKARVNECGWEGRHGLSIEQLGQVVPASLETFGIPYVQVDTVPLNTDSTDLPAHKKRLRAFLAADEKSDRDFMLAHFTQAEFTGSFYGGHISPVGAFDLARERVLVIDVDPDCGEPYWVSFDLFFEGLVGATKKRGYKGGGYIRIRIR